MFHDLLRLMGAHQAFFHDSRDGFVLVAFAETDAFIEPILISERTDFFQKFGCPQRVPHVQGNGSLEENRDCH